MLKTIIDKLLQKDTRKWWLKNFFFIVLTALILFLFSGTFKWTAAWIYLAFILAIVIANAVAMDTELMAERSQLQEGTKKWDIILSTTVAIWGPLTMLITAGLDKRYGWSQDPTMEQQVVAAAFFLLGGLLGTWAMAANRYFSGTVRIQEKRNHSVASGGPYRFVRHPGYVGGIVSILMTPVILGSCYAFIPAILTSIAYVIRTALEDRVLKNELAGYDEYSRRVRYRLLPGIW